MARINIDDQFWIDALSVVAAIGDQDKALGQALRFFKMAQEKHKSGKLISEEEFQRAGFSEALIGPFAERVAGGFQAVGAQKHFGWLTQKAKAGRKGGRSKTEAKTSKLKQNRSRTEANQSKTEASISSSISSSKEKNITSALVPTSLHQLAVVWNENCGDLPKVREWNKDRDRLVKKLPEYFGEQDMRQLTLRVMKSDFLTGKVKKWRASFDWVLKKRSAILEGNYDNDTAPAIRVVL